MTDSMRRFKPLNSPPLRGTRARRTTKPRTRCAHGIEARCSRSSPDRRQRTAQCDTRGSCAPYRTLSPGVGAAPIVASPDLSLDGRGNVSRATDCLARGARRLHHCTSTTLQILEQQSQRAIEDLSRIARRDDMPPERLHAAELLVRLARDRELQLVALRRQGVSVGRDAILIAGVTTGPGAAAVGVGATGFVASNPCRGSGIFRIVDGTGGKGRSEATSCSTSRFPLW